MTERNFGQRTGVGRGQARSAEEFAEIYCGMGWGRTWGDRNEFRSTGRRGARKSSPKFIAARVGGEHGATEMNFGQRADAERGRVRRNLLRHGSALAMGDRNEFRSTGRRGVGWTQGAAGFAAIYCGMGLRWRWATEMNFGQRAGAERGRVRRNLLRRGLGEDMGRPK